MTDTPLPHMSASKLNLHQDDDLEPLDNIPSNLDVALNGGTIHHYPSPSAGKEANASLLGPESLRRLSISTNSSMGQSRAASPYPQSARTGPKTWKVYLQGFWDENRGLFLVTFSQVFGASMNMTTRLLELEEDKLEPFQILFARQVITATLCSLWMWYNDIPDFPLGAKPVRKLLVARSVSGFFGIFGTYYALQYLPLADAVVLTFLAPSVASYGCYLFLREPFPRSAQYASLFSLLGVVMIARPTSFFSASQDTTQQPTTINTTSLEPSYAIPTSTQRLSAVGVAMLGVLGSAGAFTSIRWIGNRAHPLLSVNYFSVFCALMSTLALSLAKPLHLSDTLGFALPSNFRQWMMLIFLGVCGFVMQFLLTQGLSSGGRQNGARATNFVYTNMLFALALDKLVFGISPGWWSLGGSGLILGSAVFVAIKKQQVEGGRGDEESLNGGLPEEELAMLGGGSPRGDEEEEENIRQNDADEAVTVAGRNRVRDFGLHPT